MQYTGIDEYFNRWHVFLCVSLPILNFSDFQPFLISGQNFPVEVQTPAKLI